MPATTTFRLSPEAVSIEQPLADHEVLVVGVGLGHERAVLAEPGDRGVGALGPVERVELPDRRRVDAGDVALLAADDRLVVADMGGGLHARHACQRIALGGLERRPVRAVDDVRGADLVGHGRLDRGAQAGAEHRHHRHEREPDHQRGGGRRGAAGIARGVRAGQLAGHAAARLAGQPTTRVSGLTRCGAAKATPRNSAMMPPPSSSGHADDAQAAREDAGADGHDRGRDHGDGRLQRVGGETRGRQRRSPRGPPRSAVRGSPAAPA